MRYLVQRLSAHLNVLVAHALNKFVGLHEVPAPHQRKQGQVVRLGVGLEAGGAFDVLEQRQRRGALREAPLAAGVEDRVVRPEVRLEPEGPAELRSF